MGKCDLSGLVTQFGKMLLSGAAKLSDTITPPPKPAAPTAAAAQVVSEDDAHLEEGKHEVYSTLSSDEAADPEAPSNRDHRTRGEKAVNVLGAFADLITPRPAAPNDQRVEWDDDDPGLPSVDDAREDWVLKPKKTITHQEKLYYQQAYAAHPDFYTPDILKQMGLTLEDVKPASPKP